jgi:hypothetical protein
MRGPYAQFNLDEVKLIHAWAVLNERVADKSDIYSEVDIEFIREIKSKCEAAIKSDPRLRQPMKELPAQEIRDAMHRMR